MICLCFLLPYKFTLRVQIKIFSKRSVIPFRTSVVHDPYFLAGIFIFALICCTLLYNNTNICYCKLLLYTIYNKAITQMQFCQKHLPALKGLDK